MSIYKEFTNVSIKQENDVIEIMKIATNTTVSKPSNLILGS